MNPRNTMLNTLDEAMNLIANGQAEAAMLPLWRINMMLRDLDIRPPLPGQDEFNASIRDSIRKIAGTDKLPPMQPIKRKQKKRIPPNSVIRVPCPRCGAKVGDPCFGFTNAGRNGVVDTSKTIATFHTARNEKAYKSFSRPIKVEATDV